METKEIFVVEPEQTGLEVIYNTQYRAPPKPLYRLTGAGIRTVEHMTLEDYEACRSSEPSPTNEMGTESWAPIQIDRESPEFGDALQKTETALRTIEGSNGYGQTEPEEKASIVLAIRGTLTTLKEANPTLALIQQGLVAPLQFIAAKFTAAAMGEAAKAAVAAIFKWIAGL